MDKFSGKARGAPVLQIVAASLEAHRFDADRLREPGIEPALEKRGDRALGVTLDEERKVHKTAAASPEKMKRPNE